METNASSSDSTAAICLAALGDSTRRAIFEVLARGPCSVAQLTSHLDVTRPAVSQHLRVLQDSGLVKYEVFGTRHIYQINAVGLASLRDYLDSLWQRALLDFKAEAERSFTEKTDKKENHK